MLKITTQTLQSPLEWPKICNYTKLTQETVKKLSQTD